MNNANSHAKAWSVITPGGRVLVHTVATHSTSTCEAFRGYMGLHSWAAAKANGYALERVEVRRIIQHAPGMAAMTTAPEDVALIVSAVENHFGVTPTMVFSQVRSEPVNTARQVSVWLVDTLTTHRPGAIAGFFGRNHALVAHARRYIDARITTEPKFAAAVAHLKDQAAQLISLPSVTAQMRAEA